MTDQRVLPDPFGGAAHRAMARHLTPPLAAGAVETEVPISATGRVDVSFPTRAPILLAAPRATVGFAAPLRLRAFLDPDGVDTALPPLTFAEHTPIGSHLPLFRPASSSETGQSGPFTLDLLLDVGEDAIPAAEVTDFVSLHLVQGIMGRLLVLLGHEPGVIRRQAAEIAAMRRLGTARRNALDRHGADLGVPRLSDRLRFEPDRNEIGTEDFPDGREDDARYRRRL